MTYQTNYLDDYLIIKRYNSTYYDKLAELWRQHNWKSPVPPECLPDGWVALLKGRMIAACFVFKAKNASMAVVDYAVLNKYASKDISYPALEYVMTLCIGEAKSHVGSKGIIMTLSSHPGIQKFNNQCGFHTAETNVTTMVIPVGFNSNLDFIKD